MVTYCLPESEQPPEENRAALLAGFWTYAAIACPKKLDKLVLDDVPAVMPVQIANIALGRPKALILAGPVAVVFFQGASSYDRCVLPEEILQYLTTEQRRHIGYRSDKDLRRFRLMITDVHRVLNEGRELYDELRRRLLAGEPIDAARVREIIDNGALNSGATPDGEGDQASPEEAQQPQ